MGNYLKITANAAGKRADNFIADITGRSRSYITSLIESEDILINGMPCRKSGGIKEGDIIEITFTEPPAPDITPKEIAFETVLDTPRYAVINKPAGITVHPSPGHYDDSLINGLLHAFKIDDDTDSFRPGVVHRLDKDTSGLLVVAKDRNAREVLSKLFQDRAIDKYYLAVAKGVVKNNSITVDAAIGRDKKHRKRMAVVEDGRNALTEINVKERYKNATLVDIRLFTGRTHQIRVHMKHIGHPLLGDELYGGADCVKQFHRQALHAYRLEFTDPFTNEDVRLSTNLPDDIYDLIKKLKKA